MHRPLRAAFLGQSGPYAPVALRILLQSNLPVEWKLVVEGLRRGATPVHRLLPPQPATIPPRGESLRQVAVSAGVPTLLSSDINGAPAVDILSAQRVDWLVCVGFDRLFSVDVLSTAGMGGLNAHPSALPELRGPSPLFWTLRQGERQSAVTVHGLDKKEDHGPIYAQKAFLLPPMGTGGQIYSVAGRLAAHLLADVLTQAAAGNLIGTPQNDAVATRAPRPSLDDACVRPGEWRCEPLVHFVCGAPFFTHPWLRLDGRVYTLRRGMVARPGARLSRNYELAGATLRVQCIDGVAALEILSPPG